MHVRRLALLGAVLLALSAAGCGGGSSSTVSSPTPSSASPSSPSSTPPAPATPDPTPTVPTDYVRRLLSGHATKDEIFPALEAYLGNPGTIHVSAKETDNGVPATAEFALNYDGDCSGTVTTAGTTYRFVQLNQDAFETTDGGAIGGLLAGRWLAIDGDSALHFCANGTSLLPGNAFKAALGLLSGKQIGPERVDGTHALHIQDSESDGTIDVWLAAVKYDRVGIQRFSFSSPTHTLVEDFSKFGEDTIAALPPVGQRVTKAQLKAEHTAQS